MGLGIKYLLCTRAGSHVLLLLVEPYGSIDHPVVAVFTICPSLSITVDPWVLLFWYILYAGLRVIATPLIM
ncbi:V2 protein [Duck circovirus]|uniref:V2 protein n=1 Tax=Duck circovirus TaxID=324685 RepID=D0V3X6_9CIRC|nr:V2 protein [Duck circovirus]